MRSRMLPGVMMAAILGACAVAPQEKAFDEDSHAAHETGFLPRGEAESIISIDGPQAPVAGVTIQTQAVAIKEGGPEETVKKFGEVYAFAPAFIAVHRDEPTELEFWNLQSDDEHDFLLVDPQLRVLAKIILPPLEKTSHVFTFHEEGVFTSTAPCTCRR